MGKNKKVEDKDVKKDEKIEEINEYLNKKQ